MRRKTREREMKDLERKISDLLIAATSVVRRHTAGHNEKQYGLGIHGTDPRGLISVTIPN